MKQAGKRRDSDRRRRVLACLFAAVLLFSSFPSLSLSDSPADSPEMQNAASETVLICEIPESDPVTAETRTWKKAFQVHRHSDSCYNNEGKLICGIWEDAYYHTHNEWCYDENGKLSCGLAEKRPHSHSDDCYTTEQILKCELKEEEGHRHSDACYKVTDTLICGQEEREGHAHGEECYQTREKLVCGLEESEGHTHTDACYKEDRVLSCTLQEDPGHTHGDGCWSETEVKTLICGQDEREPAMDENGEVTDPGHSHTEACYSAETVPVLICEETERPGHQHGESCYTVTRTLSCSQEERAGHTHSEACRQAVKELVCTRAEIPGHQHTEACHQISRTLSCGQEEREGHHHSDACYESRKVQICDLPDSTHRHTADCFSGSEVTCGNLEVPVFESSEENWVTETVVISEGHHHTEECYAASAELGKTQEELSAVSPVSDETEEHPVLTEEDGKNHDGTRNGEADGNGKAELLKEEGQFQDLAARKEKSEQLPDQDSYNDMNTYPDGQKKENGETPAQPGENGFELQVEPEANPDAQAKVRDSASQNGAGTAQTNEAPKENNTNPTGEEPAEGNTNPTGEEPAEGNTNPTGEEPAEGNTNPTGEEPAEGNTNPTGEEPAEGNTNPTGEEPAEGNTNPTGEEPAEGNTNPTGEEPAEGNTNPTGEEPAEGNTNPTGEAPAEGNTNPTGEEPAEGNTNPTGEEPAEGNTNPTGEEPAEGNTNPTGEEPAEGNTNPAGEAPAEGNTNPTGEEPTEGNTNPMGEEPAEGNTNPAGEAPAEGNTNPTGEEPAEGNTNPTGEEPAEDNTNPTGEAPAEGNTNPTGEGPKENNKNPSDGESEEGHTKPKDEVPEEIHTKPTDEKSQGSATPSAEEQPEENTGSQVCPDGKDTHVCFEGELSSSDGLISIQADSEALLPPDVSLKVQSVDEPERRAFYEEKIREKTGDSGEMTLVCLMDLSLVNGEEQKIQPEHPVRVSIRMTDAIPEGAKIRVLHFPDEAGNRTPAAPAPGKRLLRRRRMMAAAAPAGPEEVRSEYSGQEITFDAGGFSVYAIVYILEEESHTILVNEDPEKGSFTCYVSWQPEPPEAAETAVLLYRQTDEADSEPESADQRIVLDGLLDTEGEASPWIAVFDELPMKTPEGKRIRYMVKEENITPEEYQAYLADEPMGPDEYMDTDGGTIYHKAPEMPVSSVLLTVRNTDSEGNLLSGAEFLILKRTMVAGESGEEPQDAPYDDGFHGDGVYAAGNEGKQLGLIQVSLPEGIYLLSQKTKPYACENPSDRKVTIQVANGQITMIQDSEADVEPVIPEPVIPEPVIPELLKDNTLLFVNSNSLVRVVLKKVDETDAAQMLSGAVFKISKENGSKAAPLSLDGQDEFVSDEKGVFFDGMLINGATYILKEVIAPETYALPEKEFQLHVAGDMVTLTVPGKDSLDFTREEDEDAIETTVPNVRQPFYTVHHYLKGTKVKVAEDSVIYVPAGTPVRTVESASGFLEEFTGYTPVLDSMSPAGGFRVVKDGSELTAWYTLPLKITIKDRELTYNGQTQYGYGIEDEGAAVFEGLLTRDEGADWITKIYNRAEGVNVLSKGSSGGLRWENEGLIPRYYKYTLIPGKLVILPKKVTAKITGKTVTRTYNGIENAAIGYTVEVSDDNYLKYNIRFSGERTVRRKDVGISYMGLHAEQFSNISRNYEVSFEITDGYIKVEPRAMKIITGSKTKTYDGEPLVFESARIIGAVAADGIKVRATGSITEVGQAENTYVIEWNGANPENYTVTEQLGTLQIKEAPTPKSTAKSSSSSYSFNRSRKKEKVPVTLRIVYQVNGEEEPPPERIAEYMSGDSYYVVSPVIPGYRANREIVEGKIRKDTTIRVTYTKVSYRLEIRYMKLDGSRAAASYVRKMEYGTDFSVPSPSVKGFVPTVEQTEGTMGTGELRYTVLYLSEESDESGSTGAGKTVSIDEYATPTGFGLSYQQLGICLE